MEEQEKEHLREVLNGGGADPEESPLKPRAEMQMAAMAIRHRWKLSEDQRARIVERAMAVIEDPSSSAREVASATRCMIAADGIDVARERIDSGIDEGPSMTVRFDKSEGSGGIQKVIGAFLREGYTE